MEKKIEAPADCEVRGVIRFFNALGDRPVDIYRRISSVYGDFMNQRNVTKWCKRFDEGRTDVHDEKRSGRPTVKTADLISKVDDFIRQDRRITLENLQKAFPCVCKTVLYEIVTEDLAYHKICARWVPRKLTDQHKKNRMASALSFLTQYHEDGDEIFDRIVTGDETWIHHYTPEKKRQSLQWKHTRSPRVQKFKTAESSLKVMATVFWDRQGVLLVDYLPKHETINKEYYCKLLFDLRRAIQNKRRGKLSKKIILLHDNARPHTAGVTKAFIDSLNWEVMDHPAYSPDLAPSDYYLFPHLKQFLGGKIFHERQELENSVNEYFKNLAGDYYNTGMEKLVSRMDKCLNVGGDYVEKSVIV